MGSDLDGAFCGNKKASAGFAGAWYYRNQQRNRDIGRAKPLPAFCGGSRGMGHHHYCGHPKSTHIKNKAAGSCMKIFTLLRNRQELADFIPNKAGADRMFVSN